MGARDVSEFRVKRKRQQEYESVEPITLPVQGFYTIDYSISSGHGEY